MDAHSQHPWRFTAAARILLRHGYDALALICVTVFHHVLGVKYRFAQIAYDEHWFLTEGWSVVKGQVPYRDFQEFKPPGVIFVNALAVKLFGIEDLGYRKLLALLSLAAFLALAVALLSRRVNRWLVVGVLMLMVNHFYDDGLHNGVINDAETPALNFFLLGVGVLLTRTRWERTQQVLGGMLLALSPLSKEPLVFATLTAWLSLLLLHQLEAAGKGAARRFATCTISGALAVAGIWLVYMLATRSLSWYILELKLSIAYAQNYAYQLGWASRTPEGGAFLQALRRLCKVYLNLSHLAVVIPFFLGLAALPGRRRLVGIGALATFVASLYAVTIGGGYSSRYFIMAMAGTFFCVVLGAVALDGLVQRWGSVARHALGAAWLGIALLLTGPRFAAESKKYASYAPAPPPVDPADIDFVRQHASPEDTIFTVDDPLLYVYSDRVSAFRGGIVLDEIIEYYPGDTDEERLSVIRDGLEEKRPKLIIFGNTLFGPRRKQRYIAAVVMPFIRDGGYTPLNDRFYVRPD
ncbi:MAG TPA: hypothetical protein VFS67_17520 [Polyangiaceae bacterium]|nr:hypothetical protein [Polyangiaceae bacterium]